ncbi:MAG: MFS transporter [Rhodospirillales bacterium]|jgi:FSR family fosmidomycin resistance protein-like MFS transporter
MSHRSGRLAIVFSCIGHAQMHVLAALYLTVVLALETDWQASYDHLLRLWTLGALLIGLGAPLAGWLGDRWSESRMMVVFHTLTGLGAVAAGLAPDETGLVLGLALLGIGASIYHPVGLAWIVKNAENRGSALAWNGIFGGIGVAAAGFVAGGLSDVVSWRAAMIVPGLVCMATGLLLAILIARGTVVDRTVDAKPVPRPSRGDTVRVFLLLSVTMLCAGLVYNSMATIMPKWFGDRMPGIVGGGTMGVGALVSLVFLVGALPQLLGGWLVDRLPPKRIYVAMLLLQVPVLALAATAVGYPLFALAALTVAMLNIQVPAENELLARFTPARHRGLAYGAKFVLAFGSGPAAVQFAAWTYDATGRFDDLLFALTALAALAVLAALMLPGREDRPGAVPPSSLPAPGTAD